MQRRTGTLRSLSGCRPHSILEYEACHGSLGQNPRVRCFSWDRGLGISHTRFQNLLRKFAADPSEMWRLQIARRDPTSAQLSRVRKNTNEMRERGELRLSRQSRCSKNFWNSPNRPARAAAQPQRNKHYPGVLYYGRVTVEVWLAHEAPRCQLHHFVR
jgi:hypothetical protein